MKGKLLIGHLTLVVSIFFVQCHAQESYRHKAEDVKFESEGVILDGRLWLPQKEGPHPAIVCAHGSGRAPKSAGRFAAGHFTKLGIAYLCYDKRGVGGSGGVYVQRYNASEQNLKLLAKDVSAGVAYLRSRDDIDGDQIGLWGASQAGWIIPIVAATAENIMFTILISGPTVTVGEENTYSHITGDGSTAVTLSQAEISRRLKEKGPYGFDPYPYLKEQTMPGLWLLGEKDESIPIPETLAILDRLIKEDNREFQYKLYPGASHSLRANGRMPADYWDVQTEFLLKTVGVKVK